MEENEVKCETGRKELKERRRERKKRGEKGDKDERANLISAMRATERFTMGTVTSKLSHTNMSFPRIRSFSVKQHSEFSEKGQQGGRKVRSTQPVPMAMDLFETKVALKGKFQSKFEENVEGWVKRGQEGRIREIEGMGRERKKE